MTLCVTPFLTQLADLCRAERTTRVAEHWKDALRWLLPQLIGEVDIARYKLRTQMMDFRSYRQLGFVGECEFGVRKGLCEEALGALQVLADFSVFAGVGYKTTMGLGQTRRLF